MHAYTYNRLTLLSLACTDGIMQMRIVDASCVGREREKPKRRSGDLTKTRSVHNNTRAAAVFRALTFRGEIRLFRFIFLSAPENVQL